VNVLGVGLLLNALRCSTLFNGTFVLAGRDQETTALAPYSPLTGQESRERGEDSSNRRVKKCYRNSEYLSKFPARKSHHRWVASGI